MSNYEAPAFNPASGAVEMATWRDDYFGRYTYGVVFADGTVYRTEQVGIEACAAVLTDLRSKLADAERDAKEWMDYAAWLDDSGRDYLADLRNRLTDAEASVAQLREELASTFCPRPANDAPDDLSVGDCIKRGECGCKHGAALTASPSDYRERVRREAFEEAAKVAEHTTAYDDNLQKSVGANTTGQCIASTIRALGDSNANG